MRLYLVDLKLIQMEMNKDMQLIVFEQISDTQVVEATFKNIWQKMAAKGFLFFYQKILRRDPLGMILEKFEVITVKDELLYLDLNRWLGKLKSVMDTLTKVHVNHAVLREAELIVSGMSISWLYLIKSMKKTLTMISKMMWLHRLNKRMKNKIIFQGLLK